MGENLAFIAHKSTIRHSFNLSYFQSPFAYIFTFKYCNSIRYFKGNLAGDYRMRRYIAKAATLISAECAHASVTSELIHVRDLVLRDFAFGTRAFSSEFASFWIPSRQGGDGGGGGGRWKQTESVSANGNSAPGFTYNCAIKCYSWKSSN